MAFIPFAAALAGATGTTAAVAGTAIAATGASLIGAGISAYGQIQQGKAANRQAEYQAKIQDNAAISEGYAAIQETEAASREAALIRDNQTRNLAEHVSAAARSGLTITGSVRDVMTDSAIQTERDAALTIYSGQVKAYNRANSAASYRAGANLTRAAGRSARSASRYSAAATLIGGMSNGAGSMARLFT